MCIVIGGTPRAALRSTCALPQTISVVGRSSSMLAALAATAILACPTMTSAQEGEPPAAALRRGAAAATTPTDFGHAGHGDAAAALEAPDLCPAGDVC